MGNNYQDYALLVSDDPLEQCALYFWDSLEDDIYPKEFLESLMQMADDVETGKVKIEINQRYALKDAQQAHRDLESRKTTGSTILLP